MSGKVYHLHQAPLDAVYIGRAAQGRPRSPWHDPYHIGRDGTREEVIAKFEVYARERLQREPDWLEPLRGKNLMCWCKPNACHGDVILTLLKETGTEVHS